MSDNQNILIEKLYQKQDSLIDSINELTTQIALSNAAHESTKEDVKEIKEEVKECSQELAEYKKEYSSYLNTLKWLIDNIKSGLGKVVGIAVVVFVIYAVGTSSKQYVMDVLKTEQTKEANKNG